MPVWRDADHRCDAHEEAAGVDIGHCLVAIDPHLFRDREEFTAYLTRFCGDLQATKPVDSAQAVMVAGALQWKNAAKRMQKGIPVGLA